MVTRLRKAAPRRGAALPEEPEPRPRSRPPGRRRPAPRRRLKAGVICGLAGLLVLGALGAVVLELDLERYLELQGIRVEGVAATSEEEVLARAGLRPGQSLLRLDRGAAAARIEEDPRVERAEVSVDWRRRRVVLRLHERTPIALVSGHGLVDRGGTLWQLDRRSGRLDLPVITGLERFPAEVHARHLGEAAHLLAEASRTLPALGVSQLDLTEEGPVLYFEGGPGPVLMGYQRYAQKLGLLGRVLAAHPEVAQSPMDLRWQSRVVVPGQAGERGRT
jgi:cell division septal protein FtsQ